MSVFFKHYTYIVHKYYVVFKSYDECVLFGLYISTYYVGIVVKNEKKNNVIFRHYRPNCGHVRARLIFKIVSGALRVPTNGGHDTFWLQVFSRDPCQFRTFPMSCEIFLQDQHSIIYVINSAFIMWYIHVLYILTLSTTGTETRRRCYIITDGSGFRD